MTGASGTEERLRETFDALANEVRPAPGAYRRAHVVWRRRERKRRLVVAILAAVVFTAADAVGLWALNHAEAHSHIIFSDPTQAGNAPIGRLGQP